MKRSALSDTNPSYSNDAPRTITEIVYRRLRLDIVWGVLAPGSALRSDDLRERYGVGVSPLREALTRLMAERLVTSVGQRGFRVADISNHDVIDVMETRLVIEKAALKASLEKGDIAWESRLVAAFHALSRIPIPRSQDDGSAEEWAECHRNFHMCLLSACGSSWQMNLASLLFDQAERFRLVRVRRIDKPKLTRDTMEEHKQIVDAALGRDFESSFAALEQHYRATSNEVLASIEHGKPLEDV
ncbi:MULTISPECIES: FCD domain-containing protein [Rhizobium/Agrobacterium group]|uniref:FCD domain-containing protein n=1 Tax=Rhizobium/Agrobacterium group TaxID=227290 RepID=UPI001ADBA4F8|nr:MULTISPECIES: FCD domain-containing protein [Rhizobium/Agrobacterium group]MBO9112574.1 FCD domain-containing protein [Agrobacterium sp. S2/73]QXZ76077.1 FCD domain-containing protein [Agrobacterium sp. S7/73]QYA16917.1 FCD domain-containing protein [Rhizobium sp. AB2/73]UEQ85511.1 FCD domain-containing protein [Rhizobium sp. AB2/73]